MKRWRILVLSFVIAAIAIVMAQLVTGRHEQSATGSSSSVVGVQPITNEQFTSEEGRREKANLPATIAIPSDYALVPGMTVPAADSWDALVSLLLPDERALVDAMRLRYPEAYAFKSAKQLRWMIEHGYPMPNEIIAANRMPMQELKQLAIAGNVKAAMLARERLMSEAIEASEQLGTAFNDSPLMKDVGFMEAVVRNRNCSPFSFYISARRYEELARARLDNSALGALAAHAVIGSLGDPRSQEYAQRLADAFPFGGRSAMELAQLSVLERRLVPANCPTSRFPLN